VSIHSDPIAFVLDALWAHTTQNGRFDAAATLRGLVAEHHYAEAMMLAVAIELDKVKRADQVSFWGERLPTLEQAVAHKLPVLDELGRRQLFWFLAEHMNDLRDLPSNPPPRPCPPPPPVSK
jgi:hypothetical protein